MLDALGSTMDDCPEIPVVSLPGQVESESRPSLQLPRLPSKRSATFSSSSRTSTFGSAPEPAALGRADSQFSVGSLLTWLYTLLAAPDVPTVASHLSLLPDDLTVRALGLTPDSATDPATDPALPSTLAASTEERDGSLPHSRLFVRRARLSNVGGAKYHAKERIAAFPIVLAVDSPVLDALVASPWFSVLYVVWHTVLVLLLALGGVVSVSSAIGFYLLFSASIAFHVSRIETSLLLRLAIFNWGALGLSVVCLSIVVCSLSELPYDAVVLGPFLGLSSSWFKLISVSALLLLVYLFLLLLLVDTFVDFSFSVKISMHLLFLLHAIVACLKPALVFADLLRPRTVCFSKSPFSCANTLDFQYFALVVLSLTFSCQLLCSLAVNRNECFLRIEAPLLLTRLDHNAVDLPSSSRTSVLSSLAPVALVSSSVLKPAAVTPSAVSAASASSTSSDSSVSSNLALSSTPTPPPFPSSRPRARQSVRSSSPSSLRLSPSSSQNASDLPPSLAARLRSAPVTPLTRTTASLVSSEGTVAVAVPAMSSLPISRHSHDVNSHPLQPLLRCGRFMHFVARLTETGPSPLPYEPLLGASVAGWWQLPWFPGVFASLMALNVLTYAAGQPKNYASFIVLLVLNTMALVPLFGLLDARRLRRLLFSSTDYRMLLWFLACYCGFTLYYLVNVLDELGQHPSEVQFLSDTTPLELQLILRFYLLGVFSMHLFLGISIDASDQSRRFSKFINCLLLFVALVITCIVVVGENPSIRWAPDLKFCASPFCVSVLVLRGCCLVMLIFFFTRQVFMTWRCPRTLLYLACRVQFNVFTHAPSQQHTAQASVGVVGVAASQATTLTEAPMKDAAQLEVAVSDAEEQAEYVLDEEDEAAVEMAARLERQTLEAATMRRELDETKLRLMCEQQQRLGVVGELQMLRSYALRRSGKLPFAPSLLPLREEYE